jgi:signal transduction histidine kinase
MNHRPFCILIVDDSAEDRESFRRGLMKEDPGAYAFVEASLGEEGLAAFRRERPDCILLDYSLPDLSGLEFIERLRREEKGLTTPVIMLTGQGNESIAVQAIKRGAQDYLVKRFPFFELGRAVRGAIGRAAIERQLEERRREVQQLADERSRLVEQLEQQTLELREKDRRKDEFLAILAHELRNPLGPIRNAAKVLSLEPMNQDGSAKAREVIERQVAHMARLIDDLLDVSRIARGKISLRSQRLDLAALAREAAEDHRAEIESADLTLALEMPDSPLWISGDSTRLAQVFGNLFHNARKFTGAGGVVTFSVRQTGNSATIKVSDTGIGMDTELLTHAFECFNQAEQSLARSRGGLGLGLALTKGLARRNRSRRQRRRRQGNLHHALASSGSVYRCRRRFRFARTTCCFAPCFGH